MSASPLGKRVFTSDGKLALAVIALLTVGAGVGFLYATQVVFPVPESVSEFFEVPDLRGMSEIDAETFLRELGLQAGRTDSISHPDIPRGTVLGQTPLPGQLALPAGEVGLTLSLGPERRPIPDVTRLRADQALTLLEASGFEVTVDSIESDVVEGRVVSSFPEGGVVLPLPAQVLVSVSLGPPMVTMPILVGLQEEMARMLLDSLGLTLGEVEIRFRFGFNQGEVLEYFPPADSLIPVGTEVRLVIGRRGFFEE
jgi:serine/threonine-protein kinase